LILFLNIFNISFKPIAKHCLSLYSRFDTRNLANKLIDLGPRRYIAKEWKINFCVESRSKYKL
jgi:hypothetical protein